MLDMICTNCQSQYGQTVNVRDGGKAEWQCRDCKAVQPWVDEPEDASQYCGCVRCLQAFPDGAFPPRESRWLVVCVKCGNKRCPHAEWHGYECTGSNEPNQTPVRTGGLRPAKLADLASPPWEYEKCPFCGCRNVGAVPLPNTNDCFSRAKCGGCGAKGPPGETLAYESVRAAWNHRYPKPSSKRPAWIEAAARDCADQEQPSAITFADIIAKHWREGSGK